MKVSHETPYCLLEDSRFFNDYDYCLPHLLDEEPKYLDDMLPNVHLIPIRKFNDHFIEIVQFHYISMAPLKYTVAQKKLLIVHASKFQLIAGKLYNMGLDEILHRCVMEKEPPTILAKAHDGIVLGHYAGKDTTQKVLRSGLWWYIA